MGNKILLIVYLLLEFLAFFLIVIGNFIVCYAVLSNKKRQRLSNKYILSVASADLLVGLFGIPSAVLKVRILKFIKQKFQHFISFAQVLSNSLVDFKPCLYLTSFVICIYAASLSSLSAVSFDRFWAICYPISYRNKNNPRLTKAIIFGWWILPFTVGTLPIFGWNGEKDYKYVCIVTTVMEHDFIFLCCFFTCLGCLWMILLYCFIYCKLVRQVIKDFLMNESVTFETLFRSRSKHIDRKPHSALEVQVDDLKSLLWSLHKSTLIVRKAQKCEWRTLLQSSSDRTSFSGRR